jgi:hypothetical protein
MGYLASHWLDLNELGLGGLLSALVYLSSYWSDLSQSGLIIMLLDTPLCLGISQLLFVGFEPIRAHYEALGGYFLPWDISAPIGRIRTNQGSL